MRIRIEVVREGEEASAEARAIVPLLLERIQAAAGDGIAREERAGVIEVFLEPVDVDALVSPRDCYLKAEPGEPRFTLLGRDPDAATAIRYWTMLRAEREGFCEKVRSAGELADRFDEWRRDHDRTIDFDPCLLDQAIPQCRNRPRGDWCEHCSSCVRSWALRELRRVILEGGGLLEGADGR